MIKSDDIKFDFIRFQGGWYKVLVLHIQTRNQIEYEKIRTHASYLIEMKRSRIKRGTSAS